MSILWFWPLFLSTTNHFIAISPGQYPTSSTCTNLLCRECLFSGNLVESWCLCVMLWTELPRDYVDSLYLFPSWSYTHLCDQYSSACAPRNNVLDCPASLYRPSHYSRKSSRHSFQLTNIFPIAGLPRLNTIIQMCPHQCLVQLWCDIPTPIPNTYKIALDFP